MLLKLLVGWFIASLNCGCGMAIASCKYIGSRKYKIWSHIIVAIIVCASTLWAPEHIFSLVLCTALGLACGVFAVAMVNAP